MGRFSNYLDSQAIDLRTQFNRVIREVLRTAITALEQNTRVDSGRAAYHWRILPIDTGRAAPRWKAEYAANVRGRSPVGAQGDRRQGIDNRDPVMRYVVGREQEVIDRVVKGRTPRARFLFFNPIQEASEEYAHNAHLSQAVDIAQAAARSRMEQLMVTYGMRKRPLK